MKRNKIFYALIAVVAVVATVIVILLSSGGNGYMNVIPSRVKALVAVDLSKIGVGDVPGVNTGKKAYLFESADGKRESSLSAANFSISSLVGLVATRLSSVSSSVGMTERL